MDIKNNQSLSNSFGRVQGKDKLKKDQLKKIVEGFYNEPQSMKMLSEKLNIDRSSICWRCKDLREHNRIGIVKKAICKITKRKVNFYTTNLELIEPSNQLKLF